MRHGATVYADAGGARPVGGGRFRGRGRRARPMDEGLEAIFPPASIAIVGASRSKGKIGWEIVHNLIMNEYQGTIYPVNPKASAVHGIPAYPSVRAIPGPVDPGIIVFPR